MEEYNRTQVINFSKNPSDIDLFRKVVKHIYPSIQPDFSCSSCVVALLHHLQAFYEREFKKYQKENPVEAKVEKQEVPVEMISKEEKPEPKPQPTKGKNKRK